VLPGNNHTLIKNETQIGFENEDSKVIVQTVTEFVNPIIAMISIKLESNALNYPPKSYYRVDAPESWTQNFDETIIACTASDHFDHLPRCHALLRSGRILSMLSVPIEDNSLARDDFLVMVRGINNKLEVCMTK
jgi:hypothetical protein